MLKYFKRLTPLKREGYGGRGEKGARKGQSHKDREGGTGIDEGDQ